MDWSVDVFDHPECTVIAVTGEFDVYTAPQVRDAVAAKVAEGHRSIVVDLNGVRFLDSSGLGVLVGALKKVRALDGSLELVCDSTRLLKVFQITGLAKVFTIHPNLSDALAR